MSSLAHWFPPLVRKTIIEAQYPGVLIVMDAEVEEVKTSTGVSDHLRSYHLETSFIYSVALGLVIPYSSDSFFSY